MSVSSLTLKPASLVPLDLFENDMPVRIDMPYKDCDHPDNVFGRTLYRKGARLWLHRDFAGIVLRAAEIARQEFGWRFLLRDGLRTTEAQAEMHRADIVRANPHWYNVLVSEPGKGAHPRGMAVDVSVIDALDVEVDMGTAFDELCEDLNFNRAARDFRELPDHVLYDRDRLEQCFLEAGRELNRPVLPLPAEWWDFRSPPDIFNCYVPLSDAALPGYMRMHVDAEYDDTLPDAVLKVAEEVLKESRGGPCKKV